MDFVEVITNEQQKDFINLSINQNVKENNDTAVIFKGIASRF